MIEGVHSPVKWMEHTIDMSRIVKRKTVGNTVYLAYQDKDKMSVYGIVIEFYRQKEGIIGRITDENMGPYAYKCPREILESLTPTTHRYALKWRAQNWKNYGVDVDWVSMLSEDDRKQEIYERYEDAMRENHDPDLIVSARNDNALVGPDGDQMTVVATADYHTHWVTRESYERVFRDSGHMTHHTLLSLCVEIPRGQLVAKGAGKE